MLPIVGPLEGPNRTYGDTFVNRVWYRQKKPYNLPLAFGYDYRTMVNNNTTVSNPPWVPAELDLGDYDAAYNRAYDRFVNRIRNGSDLGTTLAESREAIGMISRRAGELLRFSRAVRSGRLVEAAKILGWETTNLSSNRHVVRRPFRNKVVTLRTRGVAKSFASLWLEYSFGWKPMLSSIADSIDVLQRPYPSSLITASAKMHRSWTYRETSDTGGWKTKTVTTDTVRKIGARVQISNPNLFRANQLGFVNPASVAWELVPFSFVVDWFVNVGEFLSSYTDFTGVTLNDPWYSAVLWTTTAFRELHINGPPPTPNPGQRDFWYSTYFRVGANRVIGTPPGPSLKVRPPWRLQPQRAANAISVLVNFLKK